VNATLTREGRELSGNPGWEGDGVESSGKWAGCKKSRREGLKGHGILNAPAQRIRLDSKEGGM